MPIAHTQPDVNLDEILAVARRRHAHVPAAAAQRRRRRRRQRRRPRPAFRRFEPTARDTREITKLLAQRRQNIRRSIHNFWRVVDELAARDQELGTFVDSSNEVFRHFANQDANLRETMPSCPATLRDTNGAREGEGVRRPGRTGAAGAAARAPARSALARRDAAVPARDDADHRDQLRPFTRVAAGREGAAPGGRARRRDART